MTDTFMSMDEVREWLDKGWIPDKKMYGPLANALGELRGRLRKRVSTFTQTGVNCLDDLGAALKVTPEYPTRQKFVFCYKRFLRWKIEVLRLEVCWDDDVPRFAPIGDSKMANRARQFLKTYRYR